MGPYTAWMEQSGPLYQGSNWPFIISIKSKKMGLLKNSHAMSLMPASKQLGAIEKEAKLSG